METGLVDGPVGTCSVHIWDAKTGKQLHELAGRKKVRTVWRLSFSADGKCLAGLGNDGIVRVWDAKDGTLVNESELQLGLQPGRYSFSDDPGNVLDSTAGRACSLSR